MLSNSTNITESTYQSAKTFIEINFKDSSLNMSDFVNFILEFQETNENLSNLQTEEISKYYTLYLKFQKRKQESKKSSSSLIADNKLLNDSIDKNEQKAKTFTILDTDEIQQMQKFEIECENQVPISDFFVKSDLKVVVDSIKKGRFSNWLTEYLIIKTEPLNWRTERKFEDIDKLIEALKTSFPQCFVF